MGIREYFKNDIGQFELKMMKRTDIILLLSFSVGIVFSIIFSATLMYLESWSFTWNIIKLIWDNNPLRIFYFFLFVCGNVASSLVCALSAKVINGLVHLLSLKIKMRKVALTFYIVASVLYFLAIILY